MLAKAMLGFVVIRICTDATAASSPKRDLHLGFSLKTIIKSSARRV